MHVKAATAGASAKHLRVVAQQRGQRRVTLAQRGVLEGTGACEGECIHAHATREVGERRGHRAFVTGRMACEEGAHRVGLVGRSVAGGCLFLCEPRRVQHVAFRHPARQLAPQPSPRLHLRGHERARDAGRHRRAQQQVVDVRITMLRDEREQRCGDVGKCSRHREPW